MKHSAITGTGSALPEKILTNAELETMVDTTNEWILERTGIAQRHVARTENTTTLSVDAARRAMDAAGVEAKDIDLIVVATSTPDKVFPATACYIQATLGIGPCAAFDVQAACTGFVYALSVADSMIKTGQAKCAIVVGAECLTRFIDWKDRATCVLFGDGAGAVVLQASDKPGILGTALHADGNYAELLYADTPFKMLENIENRPYIKMQGSKVFKMAVSKLGELVREVVDSHNLKEEDIDWLVPHQANDRIIKATADRLSMPMSRVVRTVDIHGNTSAASIPLALDVAVRDGRIQPGQLLLLEAFGGGLTWGSALVRF